MKKLRFLHISKTGGQSIAASAFKKNIKWGLYDKYNIGQRRYIEHNLLSNIENAKDYDWFTVVRNPYSRLVSEYNFIQTKIKKDKNQVGCLVIKEDGFVSLEEHDPMKIFRGERYISGYDEYKIEKYKNININEFLQHEIPLISYNKYRKSFRLLQQNEYFEDGFNIHVIKFENLEEEFNQLMLRYGYEITLDEKINVSNKIASIEDLSAETIKLINETYKEDFIRFNYKMI